MLRKLRGVKYRKNQTRMKTMSDPYKGMTPPSTQNFKALGFLGLCSSTF